jgi:hypothetical protein
MPRRLAKTLRRLKRGWRFYRRGPMPSKIMIAALVMFVLWLSVNWIYQVIRKPSELLFPVSGTLNKTPAETWRQYAAIFRRYSTEVMTPDLLAAIAQVEGSGNPVARTYWRWSWTSQPFEVYRPASSAVGMYQITDGTFAESRKFCIHDHAVVEDGSWNDWHSCWFNGLYARVLPGDAVQLTSAYLDHSVAAILGRHHINAATLQHKQWLAALIHLCGAGAGDEYARHGFRLPEEQRCGEHAARAYVERVAAMQANFKRLENSSE